MYKSDQKYTDKLDYLVIVHTTRLEQHNFKMDYCGNDPYFGWQEARSN
ncbi:MAG: hypothetical protein CM15mV2_1330 [uncultured marine virus]|nr:MAG: hypothetical protein CM15mV2_1330 [uncultured marine virus]